MAVIYMVADMFGADLEKKWEEVKEFFETHYQDPIDKKKRFKFRSKPTEAQIREWHIKIRKLRSELATHEFSKKFIQ